MPHTRAREILTAVKNVFSGQVDSNGNLNPALLAIATRGYWIQSQIFHIPDRWGFFPPGPPRLQVYEGQVFVAIVVGHFCTITMAAILVYLVIRVHRPVTWLVAVVVTMELAEIALQWITSMSDRHRAPDFDWDNWKKLREE